jgi:hypothetical protein
MTRLLLAFVVAAVLVVVANLVAQDRQVPMATSVENALAQVSINRDGSEVTLRGALPDTTRVCIEPSPAKFGRRHCFTLGEIRAAAVVRFER